MHRGIQTMSTSFTTEERVAIAALDDAQSLEAAGYELIWLRRMPLIYTAEVKGSNDLTRLEWVVDSDYRFFPTVKDDTLTMAAAGRREVRDLVDLEDPADISARLRRALDAAEAFVTRMARSFSPIPTAGTITRHTPAAAMFESLKKRPT
jgi:hypothetical protein